MEENQLTENAESTESKGCINCGSDYIVENYSTRLCSDCRQLFIKYPVPLPVKIFAIGVGLVLIFALSSFPKNLSTGIHFEKARQYENKNQYASAQREFASVVKQLPDNIAANAHLMIAAFYNLDFKTMMAANQHLTGKSIEEAGLLFQLNDVVERTEAYFPDSAMDNLLSKYEGKEHDIPDSAYFNFLKEYPYNRYGLFALASRCYKRKDWAGCDSLAQMILKTDSQHMIALRMLATVQREQGLWEESIKSCEQIIKLNNEVGFAWAIMARTYLKWNKLAKGLELAEKSVALDKKDPFNTITLALALHFNKQPGKRDVVIKEMKVGADSIALGQIQYAMDVINNKESL